MVDKLLIDINGSYLSYHSDGGKNYTDYTRRTYVYVKEVSLTKAVYKLQHREFYYGHEIRDGVLYVTTEDVNNIENISWVGAKKVGEITVDYSASFLSFVVGKTIDACQKYFDPQTGRTYLGIYQKPKDAFNFMQALSATKAIYKNVTNGTILFMGIKTVGSDLYETKELDNFSNLDWDNAIKVGVLRNSY